MTFEYNFINFLRVNCIWNLLHWPDIIQVSPLFFFFGTTWTSKSCAYQKMFMVISKLNWKFLSKEKYELYLIHNQEYCSEYHIWLEYNMDK